MDHSDRLPRKNLFLKISTFCRDLNFCAQAALVEFTVRNQQCKDCQQDFATGSWHAVVQVRQRVTHKRTFYYLEQLLLKHNAHSDCLNIVTFRDGMDFYFTEKQKAVRFIDFLESHVPTKVLIDARRHIAICCETYRSPENKRLII